MAVDLGPTIIVPWLVFDLTGQWCLLGLLFTLAIFRHLPQRENPFLVNFILTTFLGTIPPAFLLYAGQLNSTKSNNLCFAQAALMDGIAPMFGVAQLVLVFDTWCELRHMCHKKQHISKVPLAKYLLIFAPYVALWIWTFSSFVAATQSKAQRFSGFVYCIMSSPSSDTLHRYVGVFILIVAVLSIILELWVAWMIYRYPAKAQDDPTAWRTSIQFAIRVLIFSSLQIITVLLSLANITLNNQPIKLAYEMLTSMNALATFIAFATQKSILKSWKFWGKKTPDDPIAQIEGKLHSRVNWDDIPLRPPKQYDGNAFDNEERALGYQEAWPSLKR